MKIIKLFFSITLCLCHGAIALAQDSEVVIKVDSLSNDVFMLTGQGGNIGIYVGETHVFMINSTV